MSAVRDRDADGNLAGADHPGVISRYTTSSAARTGSPLAAATARA